MNQFSFLVEDAAKVGRGGKMVMPVVDGLSLAHLVRSFEQAQGWTTASSYEALILSCYTYGAMDEHFLGLGRTVDHTGRTTLLVCGCGIMTCWPLTARITSSPDTVTWNNFAQPHRPAWDFSGFGPFVFDREAYDESLLELLLQL